MHKPNHLETLIGFVLEQSQEQPVGRRIELYRALCEVCGDQKEARELSDMANDLSAAERRCREFNFAFQQRAGGLR